MNTITIEEMSTTWACVWIDENGKTHYSFDDAPVDSTSKTWLAVTGGNAVSHILKAGMGTVMATSPGAYGGECRTISVNVDDLDNACRAYWKRLDEAESTHSEQCHYCGCRATGFGFFNEPVCNECGG